MLKRLEIKNFKCFDSMKMDLSKVNILTGLNGMGKSTVMQSILLLGQSQKSMIPEKLLSLKGRYVDLGVGQDILYEKAEEEEIGISIWTEEAKEDYLFDYLPDEDVLPLKNPDVIDNNKGCLAWAEYIHYLSAYRIEPQFLYHIGNEKDVSERYLAKNGEFAIQYLQQYGREDVENRAILIGNEKKCSVADQVKMWLDMISPGVSPVINMNISSRTAELKYEYIEGREKTNSYKSVNVGFGITYVLPVVVALVSAKPGDIVLLENPEAHIHPKGQRALGELLALAGNGGVQIIAETHSDHVLNGIRVVVKRGKIEPQNVSLFYFYKDVEDEYRHKTACPILDKNGRLNEWPKGFFDEWDNALLELL